MPISLPWRQARSKPSASVMSKWTPSRHRKPYVRAANMHRDKLRRRTRAKRNNSTATAADQERGYSCLLRHRLRRSHGICIPHLWFVRVAGGRGGGGGEDLSRYTKCKWKLLCCTIIEYSVRVRGVFDKVQAAKRLVKAANAFSATLEGTQNTQPNPAPDPSNIRAERRSTTFPTPQYTAWPDCGCQKLSRSPMYL